MLKEPSGTPDKINTILLAALQLGTSGGHLQKNSDLGAT